MAANSEGLLCSGVSTKITFHKAKTTASIWMPVRAATYEELLNPVCSCVLAWVGSDKQPFCLMPKSLFQDGEERLGKCSARVFFRNQKPRPAINVTCTRLIEKNKRQQEDYLLYKHMKQLKTPLDVVSIPGMNECLESLCQGMHVLTKSEVE